MLRAWVSFRCQKPCPNSHRDRPSTTVSSPRTPTAQPTAVTISSPSRRIPSHPAPGRDGSTRARLRRPSTAHRSCTAARLTLSFAARRAWDITRACRSPGRSGHTETAQRRWCITLSSRWLQPSSRTAMRPASSLRLATTSRSTTRTLAAAQSPPPMKTPGPKAWLSPSTPPGMTSAGSIPDQRPLLHADDQREWRRNLRLGCREWYPGVQPPGARFALQHLQLAPTSRHRSTRLAA